MSDAQRQATAAMWALGDYAKIARLLEPAAAEVVAHLGVGAGRHALDVATGTGSVALALARHGWTVSAADLCGPLLEVGRRNAEAEDLVIDWREAPLDDLPFNDGIFEAVTSSFGLIFAGDAAAAITETHRCLAPGGRLVFTAWAAIGYMADMTRVMAEFMPSGTERARTPMAWGDPQAVTSLLGERFTDIATTQHTLPWCFDSAEAAVDFYFTHSPAHVASAQAAGDGAGAMREAVRSHLASLATDNGRIELDAAYTLNSARRT